MVLPCLQKRHIHTRDFAVLQVFTNGRLIPIPITATAQSKAWALFSPSDIASWVRVQLEFRVFIRVFLSCAALCG
jgi:hypothetical protein